MAAITAALVKELRERTGEGMMDCKKATEKAGGDIEKAIDDMRASGAIKAAKKAGNVAAEGAIAVKTDGKSAVLLEVNSQTDFWPCKTTSRTSLPTASKKPSPRS